MIEPNDVLRSLAQRLNDLGLAQYSQTGYTENLLRPAVSFGTLPSNTPTAVALTVYNVDRTRDRYNPDIYVQLRFRSGKVGSMTAVNDLADNVFAELDWPANRDSELWSGGVRVQHSTRVVMGLAVPDSTQRYERPDSYRITFNPGE